jgi:hypothetical protein
VPVALCILQGAKLTDSSEGKYLKGRPGRAAGVALMASSWITGGALTIGFSA